MAEWDQSPGWAWQSPIDHSGRLYSLAVYMCLFFFVGHDKPSITIISTMMAVIHLSSPLSVTFGDLMAPGLRGGIKKTRKMAVEWTDRRWALRGYLKNSLGLWSFNALLCRVGAISTWKYYFTIKCFALHLHQNKPTPCSSSLRCSSTEHPLSKDITGPSLFWGQCEVMNQVLLQARG